MAFSSVLIRHQVTLTVAQPIVKPRRRHRALPHRDADLIEPRDDIAGGVKTGKKPVEEGPERQTTLVIGKRAQRFRSEEHTSETPVTNAHLVCRLLLEKKQQNKRRNKYTHHNTQHANILQHHTDKSRTKQH